MTRQSEHDTQVLKTARDFVAGTDLLSNLAISLTEIVGGGGGGGT